MIKEILVSTFKNFQKFLIVWTVILIGNQLFIFGACFDPYCIIAALPHTFIISILINYFILNNDVNRAAKEDTNKRFNEIEFKQTKKDTQDDKSKETKKPSCPKCGSTMKLQVAKKGPYSGNKFWGCTNYPKCKGLLNL